MYGMTAAGRPNLTCRRSVMTSQLMGPRCFESRATMYGTRLLPTTHPVLQYHGETLPNAAGKEDMPNAQFDFIPDPVGNRADFQYRPLNHLLLLHEEVPDHVGNAVHLRKRLGLVLQHLAGPRAHQHSQGVQWRQSGLEAVAAGREPGGAVLPLVGAKRQPSHERSRVE